VDRVWAAALESAGILTVSEMRDTLPRSTKSQNALRAIRHGLTLSAEDVHHFVETALVEYLGSRIQTAHRPPAATNW